MSYPPPMPQPVLPYAHGRLCPGCQAGELREPSFTWWGGLIGHKILGVERCTACKQWWVKKTGAPGGTRVLIYTIAGVALGLLVAVLVIMGSVMQ